MRTFHLLVANTLVANVTNNFLWFALTFWVYLETRSVLASAVIGGGYMLLVAISAMFFGTYVDRHLRRTSMLLSSVLSLSAFALAGMVFLIAPASALRDLGHPAFWAFIALVLGGAIAGNLRSVALSTTVTLLVPEDRRDRANGLVGTANGVAFALTSVFSGLAVGQLGMGACVLIAVVVTALAAVHLMTIRIEEKAPTPSADAPRMIDVRGAIRAVGIVPGLLGLLLFSMFNNFLGGVFMSLMDPYGLTLMSVEAWGFLIALTSLGFIFGGIFVSRRGLGVNPVRTLLLVNVVMWSVTILFPIRSEILPLAIGFFVYLVVAPIAEASEQTVIQKVVPFQEQGRVFGFAQTLETAAAPITAFLIGPIAQFWVIPSMTDGALAESIGSWFGTGPDRGMALIFIVAGTIGLIVTLLALRSGPYRSLSNRYAAASSEPIGQANVEAPAV
ncbi:MAG: putative multidrug resistance protein [Chloroflexota bacterium]|nr:putative multidrug resistance protein [Chloroflexota bacterium]